MSQRRGLGKGLGALIPPGGVKISTGRGPERRHELPAVKPIADPPVVEPPPRPEEDGPPPPAEDKAQRPAEDKAQASVQSEPQPSAEQVVDLTDSPVEAESQRPAEDRRAPSVVARPESSVEDTAKPVLEQIDEPNDEASEQLDELRQPEESAEPEGGQFGLVYAEIRIDHIRANPQQPRRVFDEDSLLELASSIREIGLLQPVVVRPDGDGYELVAGERRLRAAQLVGMESIPALVRETDDEAMLRDALLENLHRVQLNPLEEAAAYSQLLADFSCTQEELAGRIGRSRPQITNTLRLLRLPPKVQRRVAAGVLSSGHARALLSFDDEVRMEEVAGRIVAEGLSVRTVEELALMASQPGKPRRSRRKRNTPVEYLEAADKLGDLLETRVRIETGVKHGRVVVEFGDVEDLGRILDLIQTGLEG